MLSCVLFWFKMAVSSRSKRKQASMAKHIPSSVRTTFGTLGRGERMSGNFSTINFEMLAFAVMSCAIAGVLVLRLTGHAARFHDVFVGCEGISAITSEIILRNGLSNSGASRMELVFKTEFHMCLLTPCRSWWFAGGWTWWDHARPEPTYFQFLPWQSMPSRSLYSRVWVSHIHCVVRRSRLRMHGLIYEHRHGSISLLSPFSHRLPILVYHTYHNCLDFLRR